MRVLTLSTVFPNPEQPLLGLFVRERAARVARRVRLRVVAPVPWSPVDGLARFAAPGYRPAGEGRELWNGLPVEHPRFLCFPGVLKGLDGWLLGQSLATRLARLRQRFPFDLIDAHFAHPEGVAAGLLARRFRVPFTITLRGTEVPYARSATRRAPMRWALGRAAAVMSVSRSLAEVAVGLGCPRAKLRVIPNGVDVDRFRPLDRAVCRRRLGWPEDAPVLLSVGGLVERKGYHRVIERLPELRARFPGLVYAIVGGPTVEGDVSGELREQVRRLGLGDAVRLEGPRPPEELPVYYSAANLFVLATSNEGWANVFLESIACGTPVVTTDVGGNREVVDSDGLGRVVPFGDPEALGAAIAEGLARRWDRGALAAHARGRSWEAVADRVVETFRDVLGEGA